MKTALLPLVIALVSTSVARADSVTVQIKDVHLCCQSCVKGVQAAVKPVTGATVSTDQDAGIVSLTGPDTATVQKAADALIGAGYYGKSDNADVKMNANPGTKGEKVQSLKVEGVHLCCGKCVKAVNEALATVPGVAANTATKGAKSFTVTGDFKDTDAIAALQKIGLTGQVAN